MAEHISICYLTWLAKDKNKRCVATFVLLSFVRLTGRAHRMVKRKVKVCGLKHPQFSESLLQSPDCETDDGKGGLEA